MPALSSRRPNLASLQIPVRALGNSLPSARAYAFPSPGSARAGLPPRPNSTRTKSSIRSLVQQRSLRTKGLSSDGDRTVLLIPGTPSSEGQEDKPSTSRQFSLTKVFSSVSTKKTHSLPVTPVTSQGPSSEQERHVVDVSFLDVSFISSVSSLNTFYLMHLFSLQLHVFSSNLQPYSFLSISFFNILHIICEFHTLLPIQIYYKPCFTTFSIYMTLSTFYWLHQLIFFRIPLLLLCKSI